MHTVRLDRTHTGSILDIGGGGEGIIGRLYGRQVTAIDNRREELDEAPEGFEKVLMDACEMSFASASFDHVTFFYTMMFIAKDKQRRALAEACRCLRPGGTLEIWDAAFERAEPFVTELAVYVAGERIDVSYGVWEEGAPRTFSAFRRWLGAWACLRRSARRRRGTSICAGGRIPHKREGVGRPACLCQANEKERAAGALFFANLTLDNSTDS